MPRLTDEQIKQGFSHADIHVRTEALRYFKKIGGPPDPTVMPLVIAAIKQYGREQAFEYAHLFSGLAQTPDTVAWAVGELTAAAETPMGWSYPEGLGNLLAKADPELVRPHAVAVEGAATVPAHHKATVKRRLDVWTWDEARLWDRLHAHCRLAATHGDAGDLAYDDHVSTILDVAEALTRFGAAVIPHVTEALNRNRDSVGKDERWWYWLEMAAVRMAGHLRLESALPAIFAKFIRDDDDMSDDCLYALSRIGTDAVVRGVLDHYSDDLDVGMRMFLAEALGHVPSEAAVAAFMELIPRAEDDELNDFMLADLFGLFSPEGNAFGVKHMPEYGTGYESPRALRAVCQLTGQAFPELDRWTAWLDEEDRDRLRKREKYEAMMVARAGDWDEEQEEWEAAAPPHWSDVAKQAAVNYAPQAPIVKQATPGRNDPCPCGSGKKYKKCCQLKNG